MNGGREREIVEAFVSLAGHVVEGLDVVELLTDLTGECVRILDITSVGLLLADRRGTLHVVAASSESTRDLELYQLQRNEGPCLECYSSGEPVTVDDLSEQDQRWPQFAAAASRAGVASVNAVPLRMHGKPIGAMGLFGSEPGSVSHEDLRLAQGMADVATVAVVNSRDYSDSATLSEQLQTALDSRVLIEQAKGFLAQVGGIEPDEAFEVLRKYSRDHQQRLSLVAGAVITRTLPAAVVLSYVAERASTRPRPNRARQR